MIIPAASSHVRKTSQPFVPLMRVYRGARVVVFLTTSYEPFHLLYAWTEMREELANSECVDVIVGPVKY